MARIVEFNPTDWLAWVQLTTSIIGVIWIFYQFNKIREDTQKKAEDYFLRHWEHTRRNLAEERIGTLSRISGDGNLPIIQRIFRRVFANIKRAIIIALKIIPFRKQRSSLSAAMLLFYAGSKDKSAEKMTECAEDLLEQAKRYEDQAKVKRAQAANAYVFSGRVSALIGDTEATKEAFQAVLKGIDEADLDAHELIGEQYRDTGNMEAAMKEFQLLETHAQTLGDQARVARAHRLQGSVFMLQPAPVLARRALLKSQAIESVRKDDAGIAKTQELLGDLYAMKQPPALTKAKQHYTSSRQYYQSNLDTQGAARVQQQIDRLDGKPLYDTTWGSRLLYKLGNAMTALSMRLRVPIHTQLQ